MNLLLDSHALLWALASPGKLHPRAAAAITDRDNTVACSVASVWELELKAAKGKLELPPDWLAAIEPAGFVMWKIEASHAVASTRLPWHHNDPFDRLLIAQARAFDFRIVTRDSLFPSYDVRLLRA